MAGCSSGGSSNAEPSVSSEPETNEVTGPAEPEGSEPAADDGTLATPTTVATEEADPDLAEVAATGEEAADEEGFRLLTTGPDLGTRPLLEWTSVNGAARYLVSIRLPDVGPYWAWSGDSTSVPFGSEVGLEPDAAGPALTVEMLFSVIALDADGLPLDIAEATIAP